MEELKSPMKLEHSEWCVFLKMGKDFPLIMKLFPVTGVARREI